jgi:hypothetical protein
VTGAFRAGAARPATRRPAALLALLVLVLAGCGGSTDRRYVNDMYRIYGVAVQPDGTTVLANDERAVLVGTEVSDGITGFVDVPVPTAFGTDSYDRHPRDLSADPTGTVWVLYGPYRLPLRAVDQHPHAAAAALLKAYTDERNRDVPAGSAYRRIAPGSVEADPAYRGVRSRDPRAVAVLDDRTLLVASDRGLITPRIHTGDVLVHRVTPDGTGTLVAGRPYAGPSFPDRDLEPASLLDPGEVVPATSVDLDQIISIVPLRRGGDALLVMGPDRSPLRRAGALSYLVLSGSTIRRLPLAGTRAGVGLTGVVASSLNDGRLVLNVGAEDGDRVLLLDPETGATTTLGDDLYAGLVAAAGDELMVLIRPHTDDGDDRNEAWARLDRTAVPGELFGR